MSTLLNGVHKTPVVANPAYELHEAVLALGAAGEDDTHLDIGESYYYVH